MLPLIKTLKKGINIGAFTFVGLVKLAAFILVPIYLVGFLGSTKASFIIVPILTFYVYYFFLRRKDNVNFSNAKLLLKAIELRNKKQNKEKLKNILIDNIQRYDDDFLLIDGFYAKAIKLEGKPINDLTEDLILKEISRFKQCLNVKGGIGIKIICCKETIELKYPFEQLDKDDLLYELKASANEDIRLKEDKKYFTSYLIFYSTEMNEIINHQNTLNKNLINNLSSDELFSFIKSRIKTSEILDLDNTDITKEYIKLSEDYYTTSVQLIDTAYNIEQFWLQSLLDYSMVDEIDFEELIMDLRPVNKNIAITSLDKSIGELRTRVSNQHSENLETINNLMLLEDLVADIKSNNENVFDASMLVNFSSDDIDKLKSKVKSFIREVRKDTGLLLSFDVPRYYIFENYLSKFVYQPNMNINFAIQGETIANGYPNFQTFLNDDFGTFFSDTYNGSIIFNPFCNNRKRKGLSIQMVGKPGVGKTTTLKKMVIDHVNSGNPCIMLDAEDENISFTENLGGINISIGDANKIINPMQIYELDDNNNLADNIQRICSFFKYYTSNYNKIAPQLSKLVTKFYQELGIVEYIKVRDKKTRKMIIKYPEIQEGKDRDFRDLSKDDFPVLSDFKVFLQKEIKEYEMNKDKKLIEEKYEDILSDIILIIDGIINGSGSLFFNKKTNFDFNDDFKLANILFKSIINNEDDVNVQAYIHLLMQIMLWGQMNKNRVINDAKGINRSNYMQHFLETRKLLIIIDEEHRFINGKTIEFVNFLDKIVRQGAKYLTAIVSASHNISEYHLTGNDERSKAVLHYFQNKTYKFFMLQESSTLPVLQEIFKNNEYVSEDLISRIFDFQEGDFLLIFGDKVYTGNIYLNPVYQYFIHQDEYESINTVIADESTQESKVIETNIESYSLDDLFA